MKEQNAMSVFTGEKGMSSLDIAEITGKKHYNVMRDIKSLLEQGLQELNFELSFKIRELPNGGTKKDPYYKLTPKGCLILASGYDALLREKIINRLEQLEKHSLPSYQEQDPIRRAELWIAEHKEKQQLLLETQAKQQQIEVQSAQIQELNHAVEEMQPKVSYLDLIMNDKQALTVTQIAQDYGMSPIKFNKLLQYYRVQRKVNGVWIIYAPYIKEGYVFSQTRSKDRADGTKFFYQYTAWTYKGRAFLYQQLKKKGILPTIERNS